MRSSYQMHRIKHILVFLLLAFVLTTGVNIVTGQQDEQETITLKLNRDLGFGLGGFIQGTFSLRATSSADLRRVDFMIDDTIIESVSSTPYVTIINTSDYALGDHRMEAVGYTDSGKTIRSDVVHKQFIPGSTTRLVVIVLVGLVLIGRFAAYLISRSKTTSGDDSVKFGFLGGAVCPKCGSAFGIHWWSLRLGFRRFDRCSNCGKWSFIQRASPDAIAEVNKSITTPQPPGLDTHSGDKDQRSQYKKALDDSRFDTG